MGLEGNCGDLYGFEFGGDFNRKNLDFIENESEK